MGFNIGTFNKYLKKKKEDYNEAEYDISGGGGGSVGALEPKPYKPVDLDEFLKAPSTEEMNTKQNILLDLEKNYEKTTLTIDTDYELYKDYTKQLDDLEEEMETAPPNMEFNLNQKYNQLRDEHNVVVERLQKNTKEQKEIHDEYTKTRTTYDKDIEMYNRWVEAQNKKEVETKEALKETKDPTWGSMIYHTLRAGLNQANANFWNVFRMVEMGKIKVEDKIDDFFFPGAKDRNEKFKEKYGKDPNFSLPLDVLTDLVVDAEKITAESAPQAESKNWLKQSINIGLRPVPQITMSAMAGAAIPMAGAGQVLSGGAKLTVEWLKNWLRMTPFGAGAGAGKAREIEKQYEEFEEEAPYMKMLVSGALTGLGEMATEMPVFLGVMKVINRYGAGTLINETAKGVMGKYGKAAYLLFSNIFLQGIQEGEMYLIGKSIDEAMGDPQDWSKEDIIEGTWKDFYGGLCMGFCMLGLSGGAGGSISIATKSKRAFDRFVKEEDDLKTTLRKILEYQGIVMEEPEIEALAYRIEEEEGKEKVESKLITKERYNELKKHYEESGELPLGQMLISGAKYGKVKYQKYEMLTDTLKSQLADKYEETLKVEPKPYKGKAYRGESKIPEHGADVIAKMKTAKEKLDYDYGTTGNPTFKEAEKVAEKVGIDLSKVVKEDMIWVTKKKDVAEKYGEVAEVKIPKDAITLIDDKEGGYLILKNADKYTKEEIPKVEPKTPTVITKTYEEGQKQTEGQKVNIRVNQLDTPKTKGKVLAIQFSTDLPQTEGDIGKEFYDKLYSGLRKGYDRLADFWEVPPWIAQVTKNFGKNTEVLVVRDIEEAKEFLKNSEYDTVAFSVMDVNKNMVKELADVVPGFTKVDIGGYIEKPQEFFGEKVNVHKDIKSLVEAQGKKYTPGLDYSLFKDSPVMGRIALSKGCKHHCIFCDVIPLGKTIALSQKEIDQQVDAIVALKSPLIYLDDKTLGQEGNYKTLPEIYKKIKEKMPEFDGFIIQTTASEMNKAKFPADFFEKAGIRYVELGVESYNDAIQKVFRKPANIKTIDKAVDWLRQNNIKFIPNVIVGGSWTQKMADDIIKKGVTKEEKKLLNNLEETRESYQNTLDFLEKNKDIISHINLYNFAAYADSIIGQELAETKDIDVIENIIEKSFHKHPRVHIEAYKKFRKFGMEALDTKFKEKAKSLEEQLKEATKEINRLKGIIKTIKGNKEKRQEFKKELVKYIKENMPYAIQNKMLATVKNVSGDIALEKAMKKIDEYTLDYYSRQYTKAIEKELKAKRIKPKRTKGGMLKGRFTPVIQDKLDFIRANINGSRAEAQESIQKNITLFNQGKAINIAEENELLNIVGIKEMDLETLQHTLVNIKSLKKEGKTLNAKKVAENQKRQEQGRVDTLESLTGKEVEIDEETGKAKIDSSYRTMTKPKNWGGILAGIRKFIDGANNWQFHFDSLLDKLSALHKTSKPFGSPLSKIGDRVHYARVNNIKSFEEALDMVQIKFTEAYEAVSVKDVLKITKKLREEIDLGEFENSEGSKVKFTLNKEQIIKKVMQLDDPSLEPTFKEGMLYTEEIENALRGALSKKDMAWVKGQREIYDYMWKRINPIFEEMYGIHFPYNPFYSGTIRRDVDLDIPEATLMSQDSMRFTSILNPSLKARSKTKQSLVYDEATNSLMNYVMQMEHFINWAKPLNDLRSIFGDHRVKVVLNELYGHNILSKINGFLDDMTRDGVDKGKIIKWVDTIRFNLTRSILAKPHLGLKQIPSVLAYMTEMNVVDFVKGINNFWKSPIKNYRYLMEHSPYAKQRFGEGFERDIHGAMKSDYYHVLAHSHKISDLMMGFVRAGDKFAVMQGMWTVMYAETKGQTRNAGVKKVEDAFIRGAIITDRTQPSFTTESLAAGQRGGSLLKLFTMFQTQPNKYFQLIANNARNFKYGRGSRMKAASNIVLAWAILPMIFQFIGDGGKWIKKHQLRALMLGGANHILVFGAMIRGMYGWLIGEAFDVQPSPVFSTLREVEYCLAKVAKWINPDKDIKPEDIQAFCEHFAKGVGGLMGLPTPYGVQVKKAIESGDYRQLLFSEYILKLGTEKEKKKKPYVKGDKYSKYLKSGYTKKSKYGKYLKY